MEFWRTKAFKNLEQIWNKKLEQSGFKDIEVEVNNDKVLKQKSSNCYRQASSLERETRLKYYQILGGLSENTVFPNELDKIVMTKYSQGAPVNEIIREIKNSGQTLGRLTVRYIIRRYQTRWGIKHWTLQQMNLKKMPSVIIK